MNPNGEPDGEYSQERETFIQHEIKRITEGKEGEEKLIRRVERKRERDERKKKEFVEEVKEREDRNVKRRGFGMCMQRCNGEGGDWTKE